MFHGEVNYRRGVLAIMVTMFSKHVIAEVASLLSDPARVAMLTALLDGESRPAGELARIAEVSPQAATAHLAKLTDGQMLTLVKEGRHHYYRMAKPEIGSALEALAVVNPLPKLTTVKEPAEVLALRFARTCYDHLAGNLAVQIMNTLVNKDALRRGPAELCVTPSGETFLRSLDIDPSKLRKNRRSFARACLDWTERKHHVAGALGAALFASFCAQGWLARQAGTRAVRLTDLGRRQIGESLGLHLNYKLQRSK